MNTKKIWVLEKKYTQEDIDGMNDLIETMIKDGTVPAEMAEQAREKTSKVKVGDWKTYKVSNNYYKFCGECIRTMGREDALAVQALRKELGTNTQYSEDTRSKFRDVHNQVYSQFRVVEAEVPAESKDMLDYTVTKVNDGVYKYIWTNKKVMG